LLNCNVESFALIGLRNKQCSYKFEGTSIIAHSAGVIGIWVEPFLAGGLATLDTDGVSGNTVTTIAVTFTGAPTGVSATLASAWIYPTGPWPVTFSDAEVRTVTLQFGATSATWTGAITGAPTKFATTSSWVFGYPTHTALYSAPPFATVLSPSGNAQFSYFDNLLVQVNALTCDSQQVAIPPGSGVTNRFARNFFDVSIGGMLHSNYSGTATFAAVTSVAVTFATALPAGISSYKLAFAQSAQSTLPPWWTAKANTGFTINFAVAFTGSVDWTATF